MDYQTRTKNTCDGLPTMVNNQKRQWWTIIQGQRQIIRNARDGFPAVFQFTCSQKPVVGNYEEKGRLYCPYTINFFLSYFTFLTIILLKYTFIYLQSFALNLHTTRTETDCVFSFFSGKISDFFYERLFFFPFFLIFMHLHIAHFIKPYRDQVHLSTWFR